MMSTHHSIEDVVARGMCIGCGACSVATEGRIQVRFTSIGMRQATLEGASREDIARADRVCAFSDAAADENELSAPTTAGRRLPFDDRVGRYSLVAAGRRTDEEELVRSSSGGLTSWLLARLLDEGDVDGVIHVGDSGGEMFQYAISYSSAEADGRKKSKYYAVTLADVVERIRGDDKRYALVGIPCFIKAGRLLARQDETLARQFTYYIGLLCGHLKTSFFAQSLAWQMGLAPEELGSVDFRVKNPDKPASRYDMTATSHNGLQTFRSEVLTLLGGNWGHAVFQPEGCNFCDDIFAETADVVFGDAWLPEYASDWRGMNVLVSRNERVDELLRLGAISGDVSLEELNVERAAESQAGNFRHRRVGLAVRAHDDMRRGLSVPRKRVAPGIGGVSIRRRKVIRQRRRISEVSFSAFRSALADGQLDTYLDLMEPEIRRANDLARGLVKSLVVRFLRVLRGS